MSFLTGIPQEQEIPAPVTTTIFLLLATASDKLYSVLRECVSEQKSSRETVSSDLEDDEDDEDASESGDEDLIWEEERDMVERGSS